MLTLLFFLFVLLLAQIFLLAFSDKINKDKENGEIYLVILCETKNVIFRTMHATDINIISYKF